MSYVRFTADGSDVYVFSTHYQGSDAIECCGCNIAPSGFFYAKTPQEMIEHLMQHRQEGDCVPEFALDRLRSESTDA